MRQLNWTNTQRSLPPDGEPVWAEWVGAGGSTVCLMAHRHGGWWLRTEDDGWVPAWPAPERWAPADPTFAALKN